MYSGFLHLLDVKQRPFYIIVNEVFQAFQVFLAGKLDSIRGFVEFRHID